MALKSVANGVFAESHGSWPPRVVALHGWGRRGSDFDRVLGGLDAIALDLPGFGASPPPAAAMGARGYAELLSPVIADLPHPPVVVGHSFGGRVAVCLATMAAVEGLVLTGVPLLRRQGAASPSMAFRLLRWAHGIGLVSSERMEAERRRRGSEDYRAAEGIMRDVLVTAVHESYEAELESLAVPVRLVWGSADTEVPAHVAEDAAAILRSRGTAVDLTFLEGVGHLVPTADPEALRRAIEEMLGA